MLKINVFNASSKYRISVERTKYAVKYVLKREGVSKSNINIIFLDDKEIRRLNSKYLNRRSTTDVISFPLEDSKSGKIEGEVYVNLEQARKQAEEYNDTFHNEVFRLVIHGILHLIGYRDNSLYGRKRMTYLEDNYLKIIN